MPSKSSQSSAKSKTFRVGFWYTVYGSVDVEAKHPEDAELKLNIHLEELGLDDLDYRVNDRDFGAQDAELLRA